MPVQAACSRQARLCSLALVLSVLCGLFLLVSPAAAIDHSQHSKAEHAAWVKKQAPVHLVRNVIAPNKQRGTFLAPLVCFRGECSDLPQQGADCTGYALQSSCCRLRNGSYGVCTCLCVWWWGYSCMGWRWH
jgi:hypothetical protein